MTLPCSSCKITPPHGAPRGSGCIFYERCSLACVGWGGWRALTHASTSDEAAQRSRQRSSHVTFNNQRAYGRPICPEQISRPRKKKKKKLLVVKAAVNTTNKNKWALTSGTEGRGMSHLDRVHVLRGLSFPDRYVGRDEIMCLRRQLWITLKLNYTLLSTVCCLLLCLFCLDEKSARPLVPR